MENDHLLQKKVYKNEKAIHFLFTLLTPKAFVFSNR